MDESVVEEAALSWLGGLGYEIRSGADLAPGEPGAERDDHGQAVLEGRLRRALGALNPELPPDALADAFRRLTRPDGATLLARNHAVHRMLVDGVPVEYRRPDGSLAGAQARVLDFSSAESNDWLAVNQFTVVENKHTRRPDIVLFVNGLPLAVLELKNAADPNATIWNAFQQLQTYKAEIPALFQSNAVLAISDGVQARLGTLSSDRERFAPWRTIAGHSMAPQEMPELRVLLEGVFDKRRFLDMVRHFLVFEDSGSGGMVKKLAAYHQFHAVNIALQETLRAARPVEPAGASELGRYESGLRPGGAPGDRRVGVIWHTVSFR